MQVQRTLLIVLLLVPCATAQVAQWDFNGDLTSSTGHPPLIPVACPPAEAPEVRFVTDTIGGETAQVAYFSRGTAFRLTHGFRPVNDEPVVLVYTLILDVRFPSDRAQRTGPYKRTGYTSLWYTAPEFVPAPDGHVRQANWFIHPTSKLGVRVESEYGGEYREGEWHRLAFTYDGPHEVVRTYLDGTRVSEHRNTGYPWSQFELVRYAFLFANDNQETCDGWVNGAQLRQDVLSDAQIALLGGPIAAGIPVPRRPELAGLTLSATQTAYAESEYTIAWQADDPQGFVSVELYRDGDFVKRLRHVQMAEGLHRWRIPPSLDSDDDYRLRVVWLGDSAVSAISNSFTIHNPRSPLPAIFGEELVKNPSFEDGLAHWDILNGSPTVRRYVERYGTRHNPTDGEWLLASDHAGDWTVAQTFDLAALGIPSEQLRAPVVMEGRVALAAPAPPSRPGSSPHDIGWIALDILDAFQRPISTLRTTEVIGAWQLRGYLPRGARTIRLRLKTHYFIDSVNDAWADDTSLQLRAAYAPPPPEFTLQPWLHSIEPDSMTVMWETNSNGYETVVEWGQATVDERITRPWESIFIADGHYIHQAILEPLHFETQHTYRVRLGDITTPEYTFRTAPRAETPYTIAWMSDSQDFPDTFRGILAHIRPHNPDLIAFAGEVGKWTPSDWAAWWFDPMRTDDLGQSFPVVYTEAFEFVWSYAYSPQLEERRWFAFTFGNSRLIFLNSNFKRNMPETSTADQDDWFREELQRPEWRDAAFRVVVCFEPPYSDIWYQPGFNGNPRVRRDWVPLWEEAGADIVISGYVDYYMRGTRNDVVYTIIGGAGAIIDEEVTGDWGFWDKKIGKNHYVIMKVDGDTLTWTAYDIDNNVIDEFELKSDRKATQTQ